MKTRRLLKKSDIVHVVNCGKTKLNEMIQKGDFPAPITLPEGRTRLWDSNEVDAWLDAQIAKSKSARELHKSNPLNALFGRSPPDPSNQSPMLDDPESVTSTCEPKAQTKPKKAAKPSVAFTGAEVKK
jgi:predicted DNA-binding transcriptional regulator AlpA